MVEKCGCRGGNSVWPCYPFRAQVLLETIVERSFRAFVCFCHGESECVKTGRRWLKSESAFGTSKCASFFGSCMSHEKRVRWQKKLKIRVGEADRAGPEEAGSQTEYTHALGVCMLHVR